MAVISPSGHPTATINRQILSLAVPSLGALIAEPLFVLVDSAIIGRVGTTELAGLSLASTVLVTVVGMCVFLAYATTAAVARRAGAGDRSGAWQVGVDGLWLAAGLGVVLAVLAWVLTPWAVSALGAQGDVAVQAGLYLRASAPGLPGMLLVLAGTGALRGLKDTRTPLVVAATGAVVNAGLNVALVYGAGLGVIGSGLGTALTQLGMGAVFVVMVVRGARRAKVSMRPAPGGVLGQIRSGTPLLIRTLSLRVAVLVTVAVATHLGPTALAAHQVVNALWGLAAFALDALAIAAQALIGHAVGARDSATIRAVLRRTLTWGVGAGAVVGVILGAGGWPISALFSTDDAVRHAVTVTVIVLGVLMPMAGWVFVLDGVLIGAGDGRYLAATGMITLAAYLPAAWAVYTWAPQGWAGLAWLWAAFAGVFMAARAVTTGLRARGESWMTPAR